MNNFNWVLDNPSGLKNKFLRAINRVKNNFPVPKILEIGTMTGSSISTIIDLFNCPNLEATAIENWESLKNNLNNVESGLEHKTIDVDDLKNEFYSTTKKQVRLIDENNSILGLNKLLRDKEKFNFIHVDPRLISLHFIIELNMCWTMLENDGILALNVNNQYLQGVEYFQKGLDEFLTNFKGNYINISSDDILFLKKSKYSVKIEKSISPLELEEGSGNDSRKNAFEKKIAEFGDKVNIKDTLEPDKYEYYSILKFHIWHVYIHPSICSRFYKKFNYCIKNDELFYDNLVNLLIMVKNAGEGFRDILLKNKPFIDNWCILDTGSTDNTVQIIRETLSDIPGTLYEEPFINFRDSRNRLLDLAGEDHAFNIMLDDTYVLSGDGLRDFLTIIREDDKADCVGITIEDSERQYISVRVTKPKRRLRYINKVHEVIEFEGILSVAVPYAKGCVKDIVDGYMLARTSARKDTDIETLLEMHKQNPSDPRTLYYLADSYLNKKDWEQSLKYFEMRVLLEGYNLEKQDALYYAAALSHYHIGKPWEECEKLYLNSHNFLGKSPESVYFIGKHYYDIKDYNKAYFYMKKAFELGIPEIQMSFRKNIYFYHIPYDLTEVAYLKSDYQLAQKCCERIVEHKEYMNQKTANWLEMLSLINNSDHTLKKARISKKKVICFVCPRSWDKWDGETFVVKGLGGSENFCVKYAEMLAKEHYVIIFCDCEVQKIYNKVIYKNMKDYLNFLNNFHIDVCLVNRAPEYLKVSKLNNIQKVYLVLHDIMVENTILPLDSFDKVLCISEWHRQQFLQFFPDLVNSLEIVSYGIDTKLYSNCVKEPYSFIFPSFANRGLLPLLQMFPKIVQQFPFARLRVFCDFDNWWLNKFHSETVEKIKVLLEEQKGNIINYGWVNGETLRNYWNISKIWFYPCTFAETCCLTAYEAAASRTLAITTDLAALTESVGDRGIIISGNPLEEEWQNTALERVLRVLRNEEDVEPYITSNYNWVRDDKNFDKVVGDFEVQTNIVN